MQPPRRNNYTVLIEIKVSELWQSTVCRRWRRRCLCGFPVSPERRDEDQLRLLTRCDRSQSRHCVDLLRRSSRHRYIGSALCDILYKRVRNTLTYLLTDAGPCSVQLPQFSPKRRKSSCPRQKMQLATCLVQQSFSKRGAVSRKQNWVETVRFWPLLYGSSWLEEQRKRRIKEMASHHADSRVSLSWPHRRNSRQPALLEISLSFKTFKLKFKMYRFRQWCAIRRRCNTFATSAPFTRVLTNSFISYYLLTMCVNRIKITNSAVAEKRATLCII